MGDFLNVLGLTGDRSARTSSSSGFERRARAGTQITQDLKQTAIGDLEAHVAQLQQMLRVLHSERDEAHARIAKLELDADEAAQDAEAMRLRVEELLEHSDEAALVRAQTAVPFGLSRLESTLTAGERSQDELRAALAERDAEAHSLREQLSRALAEAPGAQTHGTEMDESDIQRIVTRAGSRISDIDLDYTPTHGSGRADPPSGLRAAETPGSMRRRLSLPDGEAAGAGPDQLLRLQELNARIIDEKHAAEQNNRMLHKVVMELHSDVRELGTALQGTSRTLSAAAAETSEARRRALGAELMGDVYLSGFLDLLEKSRRPAQSGTPPTPSTAAEMLGGLSLL
ncbi:hypothetical protein T492DRAFT_1057884 [Pavlovales sp. CCMP2436]|nr:hypothetical protein T492DRAFT_1057884 [Pavlovales sp. CCMP2436]